MIPKMNKGKKHRLDRERQKLIIKSIPVLTEFSKAHQEALKEQEQKRKLRKEVNIFPNTQMRNKAKVVSKISDVVDKIVGKMKRRSELNKQIREATENGEIAKALILNEENSDLLNFNVRINVNAIASDCVSRGHRYLNTLNQKLEQMLKGDK